MYNKNLFTVLVICFLAATGLAEAPLYVSGDDPPPEIELAIGNWNNLMDPHGCVKLDENQALKIRMFFTVGDGNIESYSPIFYNTHFYDGSQDVSNVRILNSDLTLVTFSNGFSVYTLIVDVFAMTFEDECEYDPSKLLDFEYSITLTDINGNPYPIENAPGLLTPIPPADFPNGEEPMAPIIPSLSYTGLKNLCCYGSPDPQQGFVQNTNHHTIDSELNTPLEVSIDPDSDKTTIKNTENNITQASLFPNPFSNQITINYKPKTTSATTVELWNSNGKLVYQSDFIPETSNIQQFLINTTLFKNGIYYCRIKNENDAQTFKILKVGI